MTQAITPEIFHTVSSADQRLIRKAIESLKGIHFNSVRGFTVYQDAVVVEVFLQDAEGKRFLDRLTREPALEYLKFDRPEFDSETEAALRRAHEKNVGGVPTWLNA